MAIQQPPIQAEAQLLRQRLRLAEAQPLQPLRLVTLRLL
jgi:hypothetical protein